jgi:hypothetical protein
MRPPARVDPVPMCGSTRGGTRGCIHAALNSRPNANPRQFGLCVSPTTHPHTAISTWLQRGRPHVIYSACVVGTCERRSALPKRKTKQTASCSSFKRRTSSARRSLRRLPRPTLHARLTFARHLAALTHIRAKAMHGHRYSTTKLASLIWRWLKYLTALGREDNLNPGRVLSKTHARSDDYSL